MSRFEVFLSWHILRFAKVMGFHTLLSLFSISFVFYVICVKYSPSLFDVIPLMISICLYALINLTEKFPFNDELKKWYIVYNLFDALITETDEGYIINFDECDVVLYRNPCTVKFIDSNVFDRDIVMDDSITKEIFDYVEYRYKDRLSTAELIDLLKAATNFQDKSND